MQLINLSAAVSSKATIFHDTVVFPKRVGPALKSQLLEWVFYTFTAGKDKKTKADMEKAAKAFRLDAEKNNEEDFWCDTTASAEEFVDMVLKESTTPRPAFPNAPPMPGMVRTFACNVTESKFSVLLLLQNAFDC